jgi:adenylate cyclase
LHCVHFPFFSRRSTFSNLLPAKGITSFVERSRLLAIAREEGIALMQKGIADHKAGGASTHRQWFLALLAETYGREGKPEEGLTLLADAFSCVNTNEERWGEAELYRLRGELSLRAGERESGRRGDQSTITHSPDHPFSHSSPEACLLKAIEVAQKQQAKSLELRATMSLARLWQQQGKTVDARQMLADIYSWFTEGFTTKDLQEAKALLEALT